MGSSVATSEGCFRIKLYPNGHDAVNAGKLGVFLDANITMSGLEAVKIKGGWELHAVDDEGVVLAVDRLPNEVRLADTHDAVKGYAKSYGMAAGFDGGHNLPDSFTIKIEGVFIEERFFKEEAPPLVRRLPWPRPFNPLSPCVLVINHSYVV